MTTNLKVARDINKERIDLLRLAISQNNSSYNIQGQDAITLNRLSEFTANNLIFKQRNSLPDNNLSATVSTYARRYFDQSVTEELTYNLLNTILNYNNILTETITNNSLDNIFNVKESFTYEIYTLPLTGEDADQQATSIGSNNNRTYSASIPFLRKEINGDPAHRTISFKLQDSDISVQTGRILNLDGIRSFTTDFELDTNTDIGIRTTGYQTPVRTARVRLIEESPIKFTTGYYFDNLLNNIIIDLERYVGNIKVTSSSVIDTLTGSNGLKTIIENGTQLRVVSKYEPIVVIEDKVNDVTYFDVNTEAGKKDLVEAIVTAKRNRLGTLIESLKMGEDFKNVVLYALLKFVQEGGYVTEDGTYVQGLWYKEDYNYDAQDPDTFNPEEGTVLKLDLFSSEDDLNKFKRYWEDYEILLPNGELYEAMNSETALKHRSINYIIQDIIYEGRDASELNALFSSSYNNSYNKILTCTSEDQVYSTIKDMVKTSVINFQNFLYDITFWTEPLTTQTEFDWTTITNTQHRTESNPTILSRYVSESNTLQYKPELASILSRHLRHFFFKNYFLLDTRTAPRTTTEEKTSAISNYEREQLSRDIPLTFINVVHKLSPKHQDRFLELLETFRVTDLSTGEKWTEDNPIDLQGNSFIITFIYKELNEEIYREYKQDQVETVFANWLTRTDRGSALNDTYQFGFNSSAFSIASYSDVDLFTLVDEDDVDYYKVVRGLVGNPINFRMKDDMDVVGYWLDNYRDSYYGKTIEEKQEIALFLRSYQDARDYYFKNLLLKSLEAGEVYPVLEFILLLSIAFDRFFSQKISKHNDVDTYSTEDVNNFLDSFGMSELNEYQDFYNSFDYKLAVVRNYNTLIKNKGTRKVKPLIEDMLYSANEQYKIELDEYHLVKDTRDSIGYVDEFFVDEFSGIGTAPGLVSWNGSAWVGSSVSVVKVDPVRMFYSNGLNIFENGDFETYTIGTIGTGSTDPIGVPADDSIENNYYWVNGTNKGLFYYDGNDWVIDDSVGTEEISPVSYTNSEGDVIQTITTSWVDTEEMRYYIAYINSANDIVYEYRPVYNNTTTKSLTPDNTPEDIGLLKYDSEKDKLWFVSIPEGTDKPISTIKRNVRYNKVVEYANFIQDDHYWDSNIPETFINNIDGMNLNTAKTKYMSMSATINMETVRAMNSYILSILDNLLGNTKTKLEIESYTDSNVGTLTNITYKELTDYIKFMYSHIHELYAPWVDPDNGIVEWDGKYYGIPTPEEMSAEMITDFVINLKEILGSDNFADEELNEFLYETINGKDQLSMNRYKKTTEVRTVNVDGSPETIKMRNAEVENSFVTKLTRILLAVGYSNLEFKNSAKFIIDFLTSTNLITILENVEDKHNTKVKYISSLADVNTNVTELDMINLYNINLESLLEFLLDYTENTVFREEYIMKDSNMTNTLAINSTFVKIVKLVVETFFERDSNLFYVENLEDWRKGGTQPDGIPEFLTDFVNDIEVVSVIPEERMVNIVKYNGVMISLFMILETMLNARDLSLLKTVYTFSKNFSTEEYFEFLISMLSFFMSYKVTLYEDIHQFDLTSERDSFVFAEDLTIWSETRIEDDWFFDDEVIDIETIKDPEPEEE